MAILITRPAPQGSELQQQLRHLGIASCYTPLIEIIAGRDGVRLNELLQRLPNHAKVIALSPQVSYMQATLAALPWRHTLDYYAIGAQSARLFARLTQQVVHFPSDEETSEGLLRLVDFQQLAGQQIVLLRGNGGRELLGANLTARGATIHFIECYQRHIIAYDPNSVLQSWRQQRISAIVVTSSQILEGLVNLMQPLKTQSAWLYQQPLITVSARLAEQAHKLGWSRVHLTQRANNQAIIDCILSLKFNTEPHYG